MIHLLGNAGSARLGLAFTCLLVVAACSDAGWRGFKVENQTAGPVSVTATRNGSEVLLATDLQPGKYQPITGFPGTECVRMLLVARDPGGAEVARSDQVVCLDQTWVVHPSSP
jgi:hypothetical protein